MWKLSKDFGGWTGGGENKAWNLMNNVYWNIQYVTLKTNEIRSSLDPKSLRNKFIELILQARTESS